MSAGFTESSVAIKQIDVSAYTIPTAYIGGTLLDRVQGGELAATNKHEFVEVDIGVGKRGQSSQSLMWRLF